MITMEEAKKRVTAEYGEDSTIMYVKDFNNGYLFLAAKNNQKIIPSKLVIAYNAVNNKIGVSVFSEDQAISMANK